MSCCLISWNGGENNRIDGGGGGGGSGKNKRNFGVKTMELWRWWW